MKVKVKRIDKELPLPMYKTTGSVGFDLITLTDTTIEPNSIVRIPCNTIVKTPPGYMLMLTLRSSTPNKKPGLIMPHNVGIIDQDYCGPDDKLLLQVQNIGSESVMVMRGESIGQGVFVKVDQAEFEEVEEVASISRGGFGSTDNK